VSIARAIVAKYIVNLPRVRLDNIVPWGRSMREYERMFDLTETDLRGRILGCGDGPASFNAEMTRRGFPVISCDPIYGHSAAEFEQQFERSLEPVLSQVRADPQNYVWSFHRDLDALRQSREAVMRTFVSDYPAGLAGGRYVAASLPSLPFADGRFDLALCSHLLFLYSELLSLDFHLQAIRELCRVAGEARVFPLVGLDCEPSPHLAVVREQLGAAGFEVEVRKVKYQLQRNGDEMMRVRRNGFIQG